MPRLPELALRRLLRTPESARRLLKSGHAAPTVAQDAVNGLGLYRANLRHPAHARHSLRTDLPVQLIVPLPLFCSDLTRQDIDARHWAQQSHPDDIARLVADFARAHEPSTTDSSD